MYGTSGQNCVHAKPLDVIPLTFWRVEMTTTKLVTCYHIDFEDTE